MLKNLIDKLPLWIREGEEERDTTLASGIKISRNIEKIPFPKRASKEEKEKVIQLIRDAFLKSEFLRNLNLFGVNLIEISDIERRVLTEMQIISKDFINNPYSKYLLISKEGDLIITINGEDHITIKLMQGGLSLNKILDRGMRICDELENFLDIAYMKDIGYLTASLKNVGTGLKAFVFMHLPVLKLRGKIDNITKSAPKFSLDVKPVFDSIFEISNINTLGRSEENIVKTIESIGREIGNMERKERGEAFQESSVDILNEIERVKGIIKYSLRITFSEALEFLSWIRLGAAMNVLNIPLEKVDELFIRINPEYEKIEFGDITGETLDTLRARLLKEHLKGII